MIGWPALRTNSSDFGFAARAIFASIPIETGVTRQRFAGATPLLELRDADERMPACAIRRRNWD